MKQSVTMLGVRFKKGKFTVWTAGFLYNENKDFLVLYNLAPDNNKFSWSSKLHFKVIPKRFIREKIRHQMEF